MLPLQEQWLCGVGVCTNHSVLRDHLVSFMIVFFVMFLLDL